MFRGGGLAVIALLASRTLRRYRRRDWCQLADASMNGDLDAMRALLKSGADPNAPGAFGTPALHWRVRVDDLAGARLLLKAGADANGLTERGVTPAEPSRSPTAIPRWSALLLEAGADANHLEPSGETPLMRAAEVGVLPVVRALLKHGAVRGCPRGHTTGRPR